jgi:hypothetical protein
MNIRKLIAILCILVFLGAGLMLLTTLLSSPPGAEIAWQGLLGATLPAFVVVLLLLINFKITGPTYQKLLIAAVLGLGILSIFGLTAWFSLAVALVAIIPMYLIDRRRSLR